MLFLIIIIIITIIIIIVNNYYQNYINLQKMVSRPIKFIVSYEEHCKLRWLYLSSLQTCITDGGAELTERKKEVRSERG